MPRRQLGARRGRRRGERVARGSLGACCTGRPYASSRRACLRSRRARRLHPATRRARLTVARAGLPSSGRNPSLGGPRRRLERRRLRCARRGAPGETGRASGPDCQGAVCSGTGPNDTPVRPRAGGTEWGLPLWRPHVLNEETASALRAFAFRSDAHAFRCDARPLTVSPANGAFQRNGVARSDSLGRLPKLSDMVPFKGDFAARLTGHPHLRTSKPQPVELLGRSGVQIDVTTRSSPPRLPRDCGHVGPNCVPLFWDGVNDAVHGKWNKARYIVVPLDDGGQLVVDQYVLPAARFSRAVAILRPLLDSLQPARCGSRPDVMVHGRRRSPVRAWRPQ